MAFFRGLSATLASVQRLFSERVGTGGGGGGDGAIDDMEEVILLGSMVACAVASPVLADISSVWHLSVLPFLLQIILKPNSMIYIETYWHSLCCLADSPFGIANMSRGTACVSPGPDFSRCLSSY